MEQVEAQEDNEYYEMQDKGRAKLDALIGGGADSDHEEEDEHEEEVQPERKQPLQWSMESFIRTASNGTLFKKHKYRRRNNNDSRYVPKEVFIKVNIDAETGNPLRITWGTGNRHVEWENVKLIAWGHHTPTFTAMTQNKSMNPNTCFSVVST